MKKIIGILVVLFYSCGHVSVGKENMKETHDSLGRLETQEYYKNGILVHSIYFYPNGAKHIEKYYDEKSGIQTGPYYEYYENGNLSRRGYCKNGKMEDTVLLFFSDGKLNQIQIWHNDFVNGVLKVFFHNGKLASEGKVIDDKQEGAWFLYDSLGNQTFIKHFSNGELATVDTLPTYFITHHK